MKILFISDNQIKGLGGGSIENRKHYDALKFFCEKYNHELKVISMDTDLVELMNIKVEKSKKIDILVRLKGHSSFLYNVWFQNIELIREYAPDLLFLGRSRFGFIAKSAKTEFPNIKVITNIDNVEWDYVDAYFSYNKGIKNFLYKLLEKIVVYRDEKNVIKYSDELIFLTNRNVDRYKKLYGYKDEIPTIVPICLEKEINLRISTKKKTVIFIGSLDYESNILAVKKLICDIWLQKYHCDNRVQLLIAGRNPHSDIIDLVNKAKNIVLIDNFKSIEDIIPEGSLMLAPIERGAGMKVKVAETLSMGLMVVASDEALVGYEKILETNKTVGVYRATLDTDYVEAIENYLTMSKEVLSEIQKVNKDLYYKFYSYEVSRRIICDVVNRLL